MRRSSCPLMLKRSNLRLGHLSEGYWIFLSGKGVHFYGSGAHLVILSGRCF
jgi:hypothetical protein